MPTRIVVYFIVACALSWFGHLGNWLYPAPYWPLPIFPLGPIIAAPLVLGVTGGQAAVSDWWKRIWQFRAPLRVYASAIGISIVIICASVWLTFPMTGDGPAGDEVSVVLAGWPSALLAAPIIMLIGGPFGEEPGFRGYGQHELQKVISPLAASLWIGTGVLTWHLPLFLSGDITPAIGVAILSVSVVYAWLYRIGGSVWPLILLHLTINTVSGEFLGQLLQTPDQQFVQQGLLSVFYLAWAGWIVKRHGASLGTPGQ